MARHGLAASVRAHLANVLAHALDASLLGDPPIGVHRNADGRFHAPALPSTGLKFGSHRGILRVLMFSPADAARLICDGPTFAEVGPFRVLGSGRHGGLQRLFAMETGWRHDAMVTARKVGNGRKLWSETSFRPRYLNKLNTLRAHSLVFVKPPSKPWSISQRCIASTTSA